jgi:hypothetical protein
MFKILYTQVRLLGFQVSWNKTISWLRKMSFKSFEFSLSVRLVFRPWTFNNANRNEPSALFQDYKKNSVDWPCFVCNESFLFIASGKTRSFFRVTLTLCRLYGVAKLDCFSDLVVARAFRDRPHNNEHCSFTAVLLLFNICLQALFSVQLLILQFLNGYFQTSHDTEFCSYLKLCLCLYLDEKNSKIHAIHVNGNCFSPTVWREMFGSVLKWSDS